MSEHASLVCQLFLRTLSKKMKGKVCRRGSFSSLLCNPPPPEQLACETMNMPWVHLLSVVVCGTVAKSWWGPALTLAPVSVVCRPPIASSPWRVWAPLHSSPLSMLGTTSCLNWMTSRRHCKRCSTSTSGTRGTLTLHTSLFLASGVLLH